MVVYFYHFHPIVVLAMNMKSKISFLSLFLLFLVSARGCAAAVLRLWLSPDSDMPPIEMCGEKPAMENWQYVTQGQTARISFTSADKAIGAQVS